MQHLGFGDTCNILRWYFTVAGERTYMNGFRGGGGTLLALILVLLVILFCLLFLFPVRGKLQILKTDACEQIILEIRLFAGLIKIKREVPFLKLKTTFQGMKVKGAVKKKTSVTRVSEEAQDTHDDRFSSWISEPIKRMRHWNAVYEHIKEEAADIKPLILRLLKTVRVDGFTWKTIVGTGEAQEAGMLAGALWAIKGCVVGLLYHYLSVKRPPLIFVNPKFNGKTLQSEATCIFHVWLGQAILAGLKLGVLLLREGLPWQNIQSKG